MDRINDRYRNWVPGSSRLEDVGVLVHGIDATEDPDRPWAVCPTTSSDCGFLSDRMSASLIWRDKGPMAFGGGGGVVLNPNATRVLCAYGGDGGTRGKTCKPPGLTSSCVPGCAMSAGDSWCDAQKAGSSWCDGHPWRSEDLSTFVEYDGGMTTYNEAIIDGFFWNTHLPHSIEALIGSPGDPGAVRLHERFLATYRLTARDVPLVTFDKDEPDCPFHPFDAPRNSGGDDERFDYHLDGQYAQYNTAPAPPPGARAPPACFFGESAGGGAAPPPAAPFVDYWSMQLPAQVLG